MLADFSRQIPIRQVRRQLLHYINTRSSIIQIKKSPQSAELLSLTFSIRISIIWKNRVSTLPSQMCVIWLFSIQHRAYFAVKRPF